MTCVTPSETVQAAEERELANVVVDHHFLRQLLGWLEAARRASAVAALLDDLRDYLGFHFQTEERPGGLFDILAQDGPAHGDRVRTLRREHVSLLDRLDKVRARIDSAAPDASADVLVAVRHLADAVREHESTETQLVQEALRREAPAKRLIQ
jgi:hypothetical protein